MHDGRFGKGNTFAAGNPTLQKIHALRAQLIDAIDPEAMQRIIRKLIGMVEDGDLEAIRLLFNYSIGRPPQMVAITDGDGGPVWNRDPEEQRAELMRILDALRLRRDAAQSPPEDGGFGASNGA
jgi:hypothetical protein